jgi:hypothetical protein
VADREIIVGAAGTLTNHHCAAAVTQVLGLSVTLAAVADDGNGLALQMTEIGIVVVVNLNRHSSESCCCGSVK